jgi:superfamily II DNA/RNA helicase
LIVSESFAELGVPAALVAVLDAQGIEQPFPIQVATLPAALAGRDVSGRAPTGSGKTLAFGLAAAAMVGERGAPGAGLGGRPMSRSRGGGKRRPPAVLVLVPTRELASQVERVLSPLLAAVGARSCSIYGGVGYGGQRAALARGVDVVVGCPGRLEDLVGAGDLVLDHVRLAVVDEADRMSDMGFLPAVRRLLDRTNQERQTLLFSATLDGEVDALVRRYQRSPEVCEVEASEEAAGEVRHAFWETDSLRRAELTAGLIASHAPAMVFCRTRHGADRLSKRLGALGVSALPIHGSRSQAQRERALGAFSAGQVQALVATDVVARGIHVDGVGCVVHFDPPQDPKDYLHRSGRTGRAGASGLVVTLADHDQERAVRLLQRSLGLPQGLAAPDFAALATLPARSAVVAATPAAPSAPRPERRSPLPADRRRRPGRGGRPAPAHGPRRARSAAS